MGTRARFWQNRATCVHHAANASLLTTHPSLLPRASRSRNALRAPSKPGEEGFAQSHPSEPRACQLWFHRGHLLEPG